MPKINRLDSTTSLANSDVLAAENSIGSNTRKIAYASLRTQIQNESKSVFALHGEIASDEQVAEATSSWLSAHVTPTGSTVALDDTLTIPGAAADAKAAGDLIVVNGASSNSTKVNITTSETDIELAEINDVNSVRDGVRLIDTYDIIAGGNRVDGSHYSVEFEWNADKTECVVNGTNSSSASIARVVFLGGVNVIPKGMVPGEKYFVSCTTTNPQVRLSFYFYKDGVYYSNASYYEDGIMRIPSDITGIDVAIGLRPAQIASNDVISNIAMQKIPSEILLKTMGVVGTESYMTIKNTSHSPLSNSIFGAFKAGESFVVNLYSNTETNFDWKVYTSDGSAVAVATTGTANGSQVLFTLTSDSSYIGIWTPALNVEPFEVAYTLERIMLSTTDDVESAINLEKLSWNSGGMYQATGIEYSDNTRSRTPFIPVTPGETIYIEKDSSLVNFAVFEFESDVTTISGTNERLVFYSVGSNNKAFYTVSSETNYIRLQANYTVTAVTDKVVLMKLDSPIRTIAERYSPTFVTPSMFADQTNNTDAKMIQAAVNYAFEHRCDVAFDRMYTLNNGEYILLNKYVGVPSDRFMTRLFGIGGNKDNPDGNEVLGAGIICKRSGDVFTTWDSRRYSGDFIFEDLSFESETGAECNIFNMNALMNFKVTGCFFKNVDSIARNHYISDDNRSHYWQNVTFKDSTIVGGKGWAMFADGVYFVELNNLTIEHRDGGVRFGVYHSSESYPYARCRNLKILNCCIEGISGANVLTLDENNYPANAWAIHIECPTQVLIQGCYFEGNYKNILFRNGSSDNIYNAEVRNCWLSGYFNKERYGSQNSYIEIVNDKYIVTIGGTLGHYQIEKCSTERGGIINAPVSTSNMTILYLANTFDPTAKGERDFGAYTFDPGNGTWTGSNPVYNTSVITGGDNNAGSCTSYAREDVADAVNVECLRFERGAMYSASGIEYDISDRCRTNFIPVKPNETVYIAYKTTLSLGCTCFEFANNTATTEDNNVRLRTASPSIQNYSGYVPIKLGADTHYIRCQINLPVATVTNNVSLLHESEFLDAIYNQFIVESTVTTMIANRSLKNGQYVKTIGFSSAGDCGEAIYFIESGLTANDCDIFALANGSFARRIYTGNSVYLESMNVGAVSYATINQQIAANGVKNVKCGTITVSEPITIQDYDFEFDSLTYTGNDFAIIMDGVLRHFIKGNLLTASAGSGIKLTSTSSSTGQNEIDIRYITTKNIGIGVYPINTHGVSRNRYIIGHIQAENYGFLSYIPANTGHYSWEGEEFLSLQNVSVKNTNNTGVAVRFRIDPVNNQTIDGTITGITFSNLGVEDSNRGVEISCGTSATQSSSQDPCIKSIMINNMRCREYTGIEYFLNASGFIKDLYIKPTGTIRMSQWRMNITTGKIGSYIDAEIFNSNPTSIIGKGLAGVRGVRYIAHPTSWPMIVTGDIAYNDMNSDSSTLYTSRYFIIDESLRGSTVNLSLNCYYLESAENIYIRVPGVSNGQSCTVSVSFRDRTSYHTEITNTDSDAHLYSISCYWGWSTPTVETHVLTDLGKIT